MMISAEFVNFNDSRETIFAKLQKYCLFGMIVFIFLPFPYFIDTYGSTILEYANDFTSIVIFPSLAMVMGLLIIELYQSLKNSRYFYNFYIFWLIYSAFWLSYHVAVNSPESAIITYYAIKILCALTVGYYVYKSNFWLKYRDYLLWVIIVLGSVNALLAGFHFLLGNSIGLHLVGESPLSIEGNNIAKLVAHGTLYLRGYGLMPHPNILAGILITITSLNLYLLNKYQKSVLEILLYTTLFIIISGVFFSFSRAGILALIIVLTTWGVYSLKIWSKAVGFSIISALIWIIVLSSVLWPWLSGRATLADPAVEERVILNEATVEVLTENWLTGTGPGTNIIVLHEKLSGQVEDWVIQPVHNYILITLSDLGIFGYLLLIPILAIAMMAIIKFIDSESPSLWLTALLASVVGMVFLFWFDHYFYTYWPAQLWLWLILGMTAKEVWERIYIAKLFHGKQ